MADFGYDEADYIGVDPLFGIMEDFDALLAAAHDRGLRAILDFVPNHSSDRHPWFQEGRASRASPKRDWYIWKDAAPEGVAPRSGAADLGAASKPSSSRPSNGSTGSTTGGYSSRSATYRPPKPKNDTTPCWTNAPWRHNSTQMASGKPGAVQSGINTAVKPLQQRLFQQNRVESGR